MLKYLLKRAVEPSTWAGVALFSPSIQSTIQNPTWENVFASLLGLAAIIVPDKASEVLSRVRPVLR